MPLTSGKEGCRTWTGYAAGGMVSSWWPIPNPCRIKGIPFHGGGGDRVYAFNWCHKVGRVQRALSSVHHGETLGEKGENRTSREALPLPADALVRPSSRLGGEAPRPRHVAALDVSAGRPNWSLAIALGRLSPPVLEFVNFPPQMHKTRCNRLSSSCRAADS
jgi:hypothetical protein